LRQDAQDCINAHSYPDSRESMPKSLSEKLDFVLKALSTSRARLAADLGVDKSVIGRWVTGAGQPSAHNLSRLSAFVAEKIPGFTSLDWDRDVEGLAELFGVKTDVANGSGVPSGLPLASMEQIFAATAMRGSAYEGFFRSTRPYASNPGRYLHDHCMVRFDDKGLLRLKMGTGGVFVDGWVLPLNNQLFVIGEEFTSGSLVFALFHGVNTLQADVLDGLTLTPILDTGRTPTASAMVLERIDNLTGDLAIDDARFAELAALDALAPDGSVSVALQEHLSRDIGPTSYAMGGDWLLRAPIGRSLSRGFLLKT
jgi:transcriptional regulator with XRE-family HTH domain